MNILIKLMSIVALVIAPTLAGLHKPKAAAAVPAKQEVKITAIVPAAHTVILH